MSEALPVQSQADIVQRELDSCLSLEYTPDSLPPLLHQVRTAPTHSGEQETIKHWVEYNGNEIKIIKTNFLLRVCSSSPTDRITWLRSNICSCSDGGDSAATVASLRRFILITRWQTEVFLTELQKRPIRTTFDRTGFFWGLMGDLYFGVGRQIIVLCIDDLGQEKKMLLWLFKTILSVVLWRFWVAFFCWTNQNHRKIHFNIKAAKTQVKNIKIWWLNDL